VCNRPEFTGIGEAANPAARIESQCKSLGESVLLSADFAACRPDQAVSLGEHQLKGVDQPQEIFALRQAD
jgi:adenylate cyclase